jgi:hypothetical protein
VTNRDGEGMLFIHGTQGGKQPDNIKQDDARMEGWKGKETSLSVLGSAHELEGGSRDVGAWEERRRNTSPVM